MPPLCVSWQAMLHRIVIACFTTCLSMAAMSESGLAQDATAPAAQQNFAPARPDGPLAQTGFTSLRLAARLTSDGEEIPRGMTWRVFKSEPGPDGSLPLAASAQGGVGVFELEPGSYLIHAAFGRAAATKRISLGRNAKREDVVLNAGGLKLNAGVAGGKGIQPAKLLFSIYDEKQDAAGNRALIVPNIKPNSVVRLNAGTYHVVSTYGSVNAVVRSDIRVDAGKLTEATVEHHAAQLTLKLVREAGGEALAETSWSLVNDSGDPILETVGPYATIVLGEGNYTILAKNRDKIYQKDITVDSGQDTEVEVVANEATAMDPNEGAD